MMRSTLALILTAALLSACGGTAPPAESPAATTAPAATPSDKAVTDYEIPMTKLPDFTTGPYHVQPMYEEELKDGHLNTKIHGGDVAAVRVWVGPEDASGVMVVKTEIENDYHHGHLEMPDPIPADARLWIEIETPSGERLKGSTPLNG